MIDITIHRRDLTPIELSCYDNAPVLASLFVALRSKADKPDDIVYLELGEGGEERIIFKSQDLLAIQTEPSLSADFFQSLPQTETPLNDSEIRFDDAWKIWIWNSYKSGVSKRDLYDHLIEKGFAPKVVISELGFDPRIHQNQVFSQMPVEQAQSKSDYKPNSIVTRLDFPMLEIYQIEEFVSKDECLTLLASIKQNCNPSKVVGDQGGVESEHRTSKTCHFDSDYQPAVDIKERLCRLIGINPNYAEHLQGQLYTEGGEYHAHYDWFEPGTKVYELEASDEKGGQRTWSLIVYLNDVELGGKTYFEKIGLNLTPKCGSVVFWNNLKPDGSINYDALHQARAVEKGYKAILTLWFRSRGDGEMYDLKPGSQVPAYTQKGFEKQRMSGSLLKVLQKAYYENAIVKKTDEPNEYGFMQNSAQRVVSRLIDIPTELRQRIKEEFHPVCEKWSCTKLEFSALYGIREYARGTSLKMHTDITSTHIISVIINIDQSVDEDWPLVIEDHAFRQHRVFLKPGEVLFYESARLQHGRPSEFKGDSYANIFLHFRPSTAQE